MGLTDGKVVRELELQLKLGGPENRGILAGDGEDGGMVFKRLVNIRANTESGGKHGVAVEDQEKVGSGVRDLSDGNVGAQILAGDLLGHGDVDDGIKGGGLVEVAGAFFEGVAPEFHVKEILLGHTA